MWMSLWLLGFLVDKAYVLFKLMGYSDGVVYGK